jgi:hypothetical protein
MKTLTAIALLCLCGSAYGQEVSRSCDKSASFKHVLPTGPVELIPAVPGQAIYFCGFTIVQKGQTLDMILFMGDPNSNCATNSVQLTPQLSLPADFALSTRVATAPPMPNSKSKAMCIQTLGNGALTGLVFYTQF